MRFEHDWLVLAVDAKKVRAGRWEDFMHGGRTPTGLDAVAWARRGAALGAGEILLTCMDADGTKAGYDLELTRAVSRAVRVPVVASAVTAIPEVIQGAGLLINPYNIGEMKKALEEILNNEPLRAILIEKGKRRAAEFGWSKTAERVLEGLNSL